MTLNSRKFVASCFLLAFAICPVMPQTAETYHRLDAALKAGEITKEFLARPENTQVMQLLKRQAKQGNIRARQALLALGDPEVIAQCLVEMRSGNWSEGARGARDLAATRNPAIILMLSEDLNRDESTESTRYSSGEEVFRVKPVSVHASELAREIILRSSEFNAAMKQWAKTLPVGGLHSQTRDVVRNAMRTWCQQNQTLLQAGRYSEAQPPH